MVDTQRSMTKMANRKTRGVVKYKSEIVTKKIEDASETVQHPPVFSEDSKWVISHWNSYIDNNYGIIWYIVYFRYLCLISGSNIRVYSVESAEKIHTLGNHAADVIGVSIKDGRLVSCDTSGMVIEWDINNGKALEVRKTNLFVIYIILKNNSFVDFKDWDTFFIPAVVIPQSWKWQIFCQSPVRQTGRPMDYWKEIERKENYF